MRFLDVLDWDPWRVLNHLKEGEQLRKYYNLNMMKIEEHENVHKLKCFVYDGHRDK